MSIKKSFENISLIQKIEIYILTIIFFVSLNFIYDEYFQNKTVITNNSTINTQNMNILKSKITKKDKNQIIKELDNIANNFKITITSSSYSKENISLKFSGGFTNLVNFLNYLSIHFNIEDFELSLNEKDFISTVKLNTKYYYNSNLTYKPNLNIVNPFINIEHNISKSNINFKLTAIVSDNVCINEQWCTQNSIINNHKVVSIEKNMVELENIQTNKRFTLKVYDDK